MEKEFTATLRDSGSSTFEITIPAKIVEYEGLKIGDVLSVSIKKPKGEAA